MVVDWNSFRSLDEISEKSCDQSFHSQASHAEEEKNDHENGVELSEEED